MMEHAAPAFPMTAARIIVTAVNEQWAMTAARMATGYAASVIGCDAEAGLERVLLPDETPDGRPGDRGAAGSAAWILRRVSRGRRCASAYWSVSRMQWSA